MHRSAATLAAAAALALVSAASAQNYEVFGIVDVGVASVSGEDTSKTGVTTSGLASSRLGFRGTEDLGDGLKAGFHLEASLAPDDGNGLTIDGAESTDTGGFTFERRATLSLLGGFGEIRLGRDYSPSFWNATVFDPFGANGIGAAPTPSYNTATRYNNSVGYFLPAMGGLYGQAMVAFGEQNQDDDAAEGLDQYVGLRVGFKTGPLDVAVAYGGETYVQSGKDDITSVNVGASYDLGVAKPMVQYGTKDDGTIKTTVIEVGATAPVGEVGLLRAAYSMLSTDAAGDPESSKLALGYVHTLSKRTKLYATYAMTTNDGGATLAVSGTGLAGGTTADEGSSGFEFGISHNF